LSLTKKISKRKTEGKKERGVGSFAQMMCEKIEDIIGYTHNLSSHK